MCRRDNFEFNGDQEFYKMIYILTFHCLYNFIFLRKLSLAVFPFGAWHVHDDHVDFFFFLLFSIPSISWKQNKLYVHVTWTRDRLFTMMGSYFYSSSFATECVPHEFKRWGRAERKNKTKQNNKIYKEKRKKSGDKEQREIYMLFFEATLTMPETI